MKALITGLFAAELAVFVGGLVIIAIWVLYLAETAWKAIKRNRS